MFLVNWPLWGAKNLAFRQARSESAAVSSPGTPICLYPVTVWAYFFLVRTCLRE